MGDTGEAKMSAEKFCLKWNDFENNISVAFRDLRDERDFFDITLACEDSQIQAHKVILSACSPFFRAVLKQNPHAHPLIYLRGIKYSDLGAISNDDSSSELRVTGTIHHRVDSYFLHLTMRTQPFYIVQYNSNSPDSH